MIVKISKEHKNIQVKGKESGNLFSLPQMKVTLTCLIEGIFQEWWRYFLIGQLAVISYLLISIWRTKPALKQVTFTE